MKRLSVASIVSGLLLASCASVPHGPVLPIPALAHGTGGDDLDALAADFYGAGLAPELARSRAEKIVAQHPQSARAHEIAALAALLMDDDEAAFSHFLSAAADLDADATELYLWELGERPHNREIAAAALLDQLRVQHKSPRVRALATYLYARMREHEGRLTESRGLTYSLAPIATWQLLGALDNDQGKGFFHDLTAEQMPTVAIPKQASIAGPLVALHWRKVSRLSRLGEVPLGEILWPNEFATAYLATWVHSDVARTAELRITTGSPTRAFVNEAPVISDEHITENAFDNVVGTVSLHAGWNQILLQSAQRRGRWAISARLTDDKGAPLTDLRYDDTPHGYEKETGAPLAAPTLPTFGGPDGRRKVLSALLLNRSGHWHDALETLQPFLDAQPDNALALLFGARTYIENEESGRAIDLFDRGVTRFGTDAARFYTERGRYYATKQLWEKAQADLKAAIAAAPKARAPKVELAEVFRLRGWQIDRCQLLKTMLDEHPDDVWALVQRGECLDALGYAKDADASYADAIALEPGVPEPWIKRLHVSSRHDDLKAARRVDRIVEALDPDNTEWLVQKGDFLRRAHDMKGARAAYEAATQAAPERPQAWNRLGALAYEEQDRDRALAAWKHARDLDPDNASLAQHVEFLEPLQLGFIDKLVPSEADIDRALHAKITRYPHAQTALLLDHEVTEVNTDGSARRVVTEVNLALDEHGRDAMTHEATPVQGAVKILRAYAVDEKGERQEASSIRNGEVRFRNLQVGSRTVLQYIHYMPAPRLLPGTFMSAWFFQSAGRQHEDSTWVLVLPRGRHFHEQITGAVEEKRSEDGDREVHVYHALHTAPIVQEPNMPPVNDLAARVEVSTAESWDDYVRWERGLLADAFYTNPALDALVDRLTKDAKTPREKLERVFRHVTQEIRYQQDYETNIAGVRPHGAPSVIERGYGDCKDKAVLLIEMARHLGIKVSFAILRTTPQGQISREVPPQPFNHAIAYVPVQPGFDKPMFLDPTSDGLDLGNLRDDDQGALALVLDPDKGDWSFIPIPYQAPDLEYDRHKIRLDVKSPSEALLSDDMVLRGHPAMAMRHVLRNEGQAAQVYSAIASALFSGATVKSAKSEGKEDIVKPLTISLDVDASQSLRAEDDHYRLTLPGKFNLSSTIPLNTRETPMRFGPPDSSTYDIDATVPDGFQVTHAPPDFTVDSACFHVSRKAKVDGRKLNVRLEFIRRCTDVAIADYAPYRDAVREVTRKLDDDLLFAKTVVKTPVKKR